MSLFDPEFEARFSRIHSVGCTNIFSPIPSASSSEAIAQNPIASSDPQPKSVINLDPVPEHSGCLMSEKLRDVRDPTVEPVDSPFRISVPGDDILLCDVSETVTGDMVATVPALSFLTPAVMSVAGSKTMPATPVMLYPAVASLLATNSLKLATASAISPCSNRLLALSTQMTTTRASAERRSSGSTTSKPKTSTTVCSSISQQMTSSQSSSRAVSTKTPAVSTSRKRAHNTMMRSPHLVSMYDNKFGRYREFLSSKASK